MLDVRRGAIPGLRGDLEVAYSRTTDDVAGDGEIYLMNADGSGKVNLTKSPNRY
jgi:hypothetical protein